MRCAASRADLPAYVGLDGRDRVVVARLKPHDARRHSRAEPHREHGAERDGHLPEDFAGVTLSQHALDPVDEPRRLDAALQDGEERALGALGGGVLAGRQADVRRDAEEPLALRGVEGRKERYSCDLLGRYHATTLPARGRAPLVPAGRRPPVSRSHLPGHDPGVLADSQQQRRLSLPAPMTTMSI